MTEFRTKGKGKGRQVYPVGPKRKPFGISRELAYEDVEALRQKGERARLIKTNKKLALYAPYKADVHVKAPESGSSPVGSVHSKTVSESGIPPSDVPLIQNMGEVGYDFKMNKPSMETLANGTFIGMRDPEYTMSAWMKLKDVPTDAAINKFNYGHDVFRIPNIDYSKEKTLTIDLGEHERNGINNFVRSLAKELSEDSEIRDKDNKFKKYDTSDLLITFSKPDDGEYGYITAIPRDHRGPGNEKEYGNAMRVKMDGKKGSLAMYNAQGFLHVLKMYRSMTATPAREHYYASLQPDGPLTISTTKAAGKRLIDLSSGAMLVPIKTTPWDARQTRDVIKKLTDEI